MGAMSILLETPSTESVRAACERFDRENALAEQTLAELFQQYPRNDDLRHVLLKVVCVNALYNTCIFTLEAVARHIHDHAGEIDALLQEASPSVIDVIAKMNVQGKKYNFYSFATKYCSWHNPDAYPIYDAHVDQYLWKAQQRQPFAGFQHPDLCNYARFHDIMQSFRTAYGLEDFSFKDLDKFLYMQWQRPASTAADEPQPGPGAFDFFPAPELA
jgi:hypothetical protein